MKLEYNGRSPNSPVGGSCNPTWDSSIHLQPHRFVLDCCYTSLAVAVASGSCQTLAYLWQPGGQGSRRDHVEGDFSPVRSQSLKGGRGSQQQHSRSRSVTYPARPLISLFLQANLFLYRNVGVALGVQFLLFFSEPGRNFPCSAGLVFPIAIVTTLAWALGGIL